MPVPYSAATDAFEEAKRKRKANAAPDYDAEMKLPDGKTCDACVHSLRCFGFGFSATGRTSCDFWPNRFRARPTPAAEGG